MSGSTLMALAMASMAARPESHERRTWPRRVGPLLDGSDDEGYDTSPEAGPSRLPSPYAAQEVEYPEQSTYTFVTSAFSSDGRPVRMQFARQTQFARSTRSHSISDSTARISSQPSITKKSRGRHVPTVSQDGLEGDADMGGRVYVCEIAGCGKAFTRAGHLKRHVRSIHTYDKPYACTYSGCLKTFSRRDNLTQHLKVHSAEDQSYSIPEEVRKIAQLSDKIHTNINGGCYPTDELPHNISPESTADALMRNGKNREEKRT